MFKGPRNTPRHLLILHGRQTFGQRVPSRYYHVARVGMSKMQKATA